MSAGPGPNPAAPGALCRECGWRSAAGCNGQGARQSAGENAQPPLPTRCPKCRSHRLLAHAELFSLAIAHIDCDAFYAAVEKRDRPELRDKPLIIGGGAERGVVTTACYLARIHGVRSAMPMAQARRLCPSAQILPPEMSKYQAVSRLIRRLFESLTPLVEPLSLDEAFLDLSGTARLHAMPPAAALAQIASRIEHEIGVTVSVGLSWNKFLAKIASELDKPRGFAVIGRAETLDFLEPRPVATIWGVGPAMEARLHAAGYRTIGDLRRAEPAALMREFGAMGVRLDRFSRGEDARAVIADRRAKSLSAETTFSRDLDPRLPDDLEELDAVLWRLAERVSAKMKAAGRKGGAATLALKTARRKRKSRRRKLPAPSWMADTLYREARALLDAELARSDARGERYRLIGLGFCELSSGYAAGHSDISPPHDAQRRHCAAGALDLRPDPNAQRSQRVEEAIDALRRRFGADSVQKGRGFRRTHSS